MKDETCDKCGPNVAAKARRGPFTFCNHCAREYDKVTVAKIAKASAGK